MANSAGIVGIIFNPASPAGPKVVHRGKHHAKNKSRQRVDQWHEHRASAKEQPGNAEQRRFLGRAHSARKQNKRHHDEPGHPEDKPEDDAKAHRRDLLEAVFRHFVFAWALIWLLSSTALA